MGGFARIKRSGLKIAKYKIFVPRSICPDLYCALLTTGASSSVFYFYLRRPAALLLVLIMSHTYAPLCSDVPPIHVHLAPRPCLPSSAGPSRKCSFVLFLSQSWLLGTYTSISFASGTRKSIPYLTCVQVSVVSVDWFH